jgi:hypothetical protein
MSRIFKKLPVLIYISGMGRKGKRMMILKPEDLPVM